VSNRIDAMLAEPGPELNEVTTALKRLGELASEIAVELRLGQPVLEWNDKLRKLHIIDSSFAFHVKWGDI
jgi:hypothetical protein